MLAHVSCQAGPLHPSILPHAHRPPSPNAHQHLSRRRLKVFWPQRALGLVHDVQDMVPH